MELTHLYKKRFGGDGDAERVLHRKNALWQVLCQHFFDRYVRAGHVVLDVGAGYCEFINNVGRNVQLGQRIALDINEACADFAAPDVRVIHEDCMQVRSLEDTSVDVIFMSNFLEHLPTKDAVLQLFVECARLLRDKGTLLILQPNIRLVGGAYWDFFDHYLPLTEKSLAEALSLATFDVTQCIPRFLPFTTKSVLPQHPFLVQMYLHCPWAWSLLGKQSFMVATPREKCS